MSDVFSFAEWTDMFRPSLLRQRSGYGVKERVDFILKALILTATISQHHFAESPDPGIFLPPSAQFAQQQRGWRASLA